MIIVSGLSNARSDPVLKETEIEIADWPRRTPPLRMALLSDIHLGGPAMTTERLGRIVTQVNAGKPHLVLIAGDFVNGHDATGAAVRAARLSSPLSRLRAPLGVVAVLGNHDHWTAPASIRAALEAARITVLDNHASRRGPITLIGVGDAFSGHDRPAQAWSAARRLPGPRIVLTHSPDVASKLPLERSLVLAGHTHCGQVVLPVIGALVSHGPLQKGRRLYDPAFRCGVIRQAGRTIIVTGGLGGGTVPLRFGAPPDWWLLTLTGKK